MYIILKTIELIITALPKNIALGIGTSIGQFAYILDKKHRRLAISNVTRIFGKEKSKKEIKTIARKSFHSLGKNIIEFFRNSSEEVEVEGYNNIKDILESKKGFIFVLGHFGNWEVMGRIGVQYNIRLSVVGRSIKNKGVDKYILSRRIGSGMEVINKKGSSRALIKAIGEDKAVAILIDQYAGRHGVFVDFFGIPTSTTPSPAVMALKTGVPIVPVFIVRDKMQKHKIVVEKPIQAVKTGNVSKDVFAITQEIVKPLEKFVRKYPEQWWWVHRRWR